MTGSPRKPARRGPGPKSAKQPTGGRAQRRVATASEVRAGRPPPSADRVPAPLDRADAWVAGTVGAAAGLLFLSTFSSHAALGDAPESVAGARSLGILHAPGYVVYAIAARAFGEIVRVGTWELRVNLFSLVCASLTVAAVYFLARLFGANKIGAGIGALVLAASLSFWFNAGFAKYYALSTLLITAVALCVLEWQRRGRNVLLGVAGVLVGASIGVSWQLAVIMAAGLAVVVVQGRPRPRRGPLLVAGAAALLTAIGLCAFIIVRAGQDPTVNFGNATDPGRLVELLTTADFAGARGSVEAGIGTVAPNSLAYLVIIGVDVGLGAIALALAGAFDVYKRRRLDYALFFAVVGLGNVLAVAFVAGKSVLAGFSGALASGGQLSDALVVLAVLAALGTTRLVHEVERWRARAQPARWRIAVVGVIVLVTVVPSVAVHYRNADHRIPPIGDRYARRVLAALPPNSVLLAGAWEFSWPIINRQLLYHDRPDVSVVHADTIGYEWYRDDLVHRLGLDRALLRQTPENAVTRFVTALRRTRPVYADTWAMLYGEKLFGYQAEGLVGRIVDGTGPQESPNLQTAVDALRSQAAQDGMTGLKYERFPNVWVYFFYQRAHVELAKEYALADDLDQAANELERALAFGEENSAAILNPAISHARTREPDAKARVLAL
jgi:Protein of unknown function (DUF2723)